MTEVAKGLKPWHAPLAGALAFLVLAAAQANLMQLTLPLVAGIALGALLGHLHSRKEFVAGPKWVLVSAAEETLRAWKLMPLLGGLIGGVAVLFALAGFEVYFSIEYLTEQLPYALWQSLTVPQLPPRFLAVLAAGLAVGAVAGHLAGVRAARWRSASALGTVLLIVAPIAAAAGALHPSDDGRAAFEVGMRAGGDCGWALCLGGSLAGLLHCVRLKKLQWAPFLVVLLGAGGQAVGRLEGTPIAGLSSFLTGTALHAFDGSSIGWDFGSLIGGGAVTLAVLAMAVVFGQGDRGP